MTSSSSAGGVLVIALGVFVVLISALLQATLSAIFRVALYRYAVGGASAGHFTAEQLQGAFRPKRRRR